MNPLVSLHASTANPPRAEPGRREILSVAQLDNVADAVLNLAGELWALTDRLCILEAVLRGHGLDVTTEIERFRPDAVLEGELDAKRDRLIASIVRALAPDA